MWTQTAAGDFDADGDADILWRHSEGHTTVWEMENGNYVVNHNLPDVAGTWEVEAVRDFNADGDDDILWRHQDGALTIWEMQSNSYVTNHNLPFVNNQWKITDTGDYDRDGDFDIQFQHSNTGQVVFWEIENHRYVINHNDTFPAPESPESAPPPENALEVSTNGTNWQHLFGTNPNQPSGDPWVLTFDPARDIDYVLTSASGLDLDNADSIRVTFEVDGSFNAVEGQIPTFRLLIVSGLSLSASAPNERFWSDARVDLRDGTFTMDVPLDAGVWHNVFGQKTSSGFDAVLNNAVFIGGSFGGISPNDGIQNDGHGVRGTGTFTMLDFDILF